MGQWCSIFHHKLQMKWQFARVQADEKLGMTNVPLLAPFRYCTSSLAKQVAKWRRRQRSNSMKQIRN